MAVKSNEARPSISGDVDIKTEEVKLTPKEEFSLEAPGVTVGAV